MGDRFRDYDDAAASTPIEVRIAGRDYRYQPEAPLATAMAWMRLQSEPGGDAIDRIEAAYRIILGSDKYDEIVAAGASARQVDSLYSDLCRWWQLTAADHDGYTTLRDAINTIPDPDTRVAAAAALEAIRTGTVDDGGAGDAAGES